MARIVLTSFGSFGDLYPMLGLALELRARGHRPVLAMPACYRDIVEREQIEFRAVRPDLPLDDRELSARIMHPLRGTATLFQELLLPHLEASYADLLTAGHDADLLVTHPATLAGPIVAEQLDVLWASAVLAPMSFFSVHDPIVPPPAPWVRALTSRSKTLSRLFVRLTDRLTRKWAEPVQQFRESLGLPRSRNPILSGQHSPHLVLALFSRALARPQPDWPTRVCLAGPVWYNGRGDEGLSSELMEFLERGDPPVVFTLGTSAVEAAGRFYEISARAVARLGRRAVLLVGRHAGNRPASTSPAVLSVDFAPHARLFPRAAVIVHQGGAGTTQQALRSGQPTLVVPHAHDQPDNADRVRRLGVSRTLPPRRYGLRTLERELAALFADPRYRLRAEAVAKAVTIEDGAGRAADAIQALLTGPPSHA